MFIAEDWQQPRLGVYTMNFCKTAQQGWFSGNANMLKSGGKRKREERRIIHSVLFGRKKWSVLAHWRNNSKHIGTKLCKEGGECKKKSLYHFKSDRIKAENKVIKKKADL